MLTLIKHIQILKDGEFRPGEILIADRRIAEVGPSIDCNYHGLTVVDGAGMRAIPGLIDQHVHITGGGGEGGFSNQVPPIRVSALLKAGITTVVGLLGTDGTTRSVESLVAKTKALREEGLTAYCLTGSYELPSPTVTGSVRRDIVLIDEVIGVKIAIADHRSSGITAQELIRLAADASQGGLLSGKPGVVHLHTGSGREQLDVLFQAVRESNIPIRFFRPTHLENKPEAALQFAGMGGYIDFTADVEETAPVVARMLREAPAGSVTMSSDGNGSMPVWNDQREMIGIGAGSVGTLWETITALVEREGVPLHQALAPCTENVARALQLYPRKGCLCAGADADLLLLDDRGHIDTVFAGGRKMLEHGAVVVPLKFEQL